ncbi:hypothetical protein HYW42_03955 [Candidatus Daviesbacteria bacterium]|nr:hypothetical protein [Candidatus Daviesbacteria bacterium]
MKFEPFQGKHKRFSRNSISITIVCGIGFNSGFYFRNKIENFDYVLLFFDKEQQAIGFQFLKDGKVPGVLKINHEPRGNSGSTSASAFFKAYDIDAKTSKGRYEPKEHVDQKLGKIFYISLKEKIKE